AGNCGRLQQVGQKEPNSLGIYDMSGNVWEWCQDKWHDSYNGAPVDGNAWEEGKDGSDRVLRGGGWSGYARNCRSARRDRLRPEYRYGSVGFRLVFLP
ncbi:MAG: formylglycine-generating enzyme family protein, partial [Sinomicrobium sp.]|nr:formylglycine-generating enzyme family protein [Sinomicrobium sp.]